MRKNTILDVNVNVMTMREVVSFLDNNIDSIKGEYVCVSNVHTTVMSREDRVYQKIQNSSILTLPDGKPLDIVSKLKGNKNGERITGPDLMLEIFKLSEVKGYTHYFYGSTEETLKKLKINLKESFPKLKIVGAYSPPFRELTEQEDQDSIKMINDINPDFLWVGLGAPKQEIWMYKHRELVNSLMIGVGAGFNYHAGEIKRAPEIFQRLSLEWFIRLLQNPKRLWKRYLVYNTKFIYYLMVDSLTKK